MKKLTLPYGKVKFFYYKTHREDFRTFPRELIWNSTDNYENTSAVHILGARN